MDTFLKTLPLPEAWQCVPSRGLSDVQEPDRGRPNNPNGSGKRQADSPRSNGCTNGDEPKDGGVSSSSRKRVLKPLSLLGPPMAGCDKANHCGQRAQ